MTGERVAGRTKRLTDLVAERAEQRVQRMLNPRASIQIVDGLSFKLTKPPSSTANIGGSGGPGEEPFGNIYYQFVQEEGADQTQRQFLNFKGAGVTAADDSGNSRTNVTITAILVVADEASLPASNPTQDVVYYADAEGTFWFDSDGAGAFVQVGGGSGAPADAQYLTLALNGDLSAERRFVPGVGMEGTDGGANGDYTFGLRNGLELTRRAVSDANDSPSATDVIIAYTSLTTTRTVTFPAASSVGAGKLLIIKDESGSASATVNINVAATGADTLDGSGVGQSAVTGPYGQSAWYSNGSNGWLRLTRANLAYSGPTDVTFQADLSPDSGNRLALTITTQTRSIKLHPGNSDAGTLTPVTGLGMAYVFADTGAAESLNWTVRMPGNYDGGTITAHVIGSSNKATPGTANAYFTLAAGVVADGGTVPGTLGTAVNVTSAMSSELGVRRYETFSFGALTPAGSPAADVMMRFQFQRDSGFDDGGSGPVDTYAGDFELVEIVLEFGVSSLTE